MAIINSPAQAQKEEVSQMIQPDQIARTSSPEEGKQTGFLQHRNAKNNALHVPYLNFYCANNQADAAPGNHWMTPDDAYTMGGFGE